MNQNKHETKEKNNSNKSNKSLSHFYGTIFVLFFVNTVLFGTFFYSTRFLFVEIVMCDDEAHFYCLRAQDSSYSSLKHPQLIGYHSVCTNNIFVYFFFLWELTISPLTACCGWNSFLIVYKMTHVSFSVSHSLSFIRFYHISNM